MNSVARSVRHAGGLYRRVLRRSPHPIQSLEHEVEHLHEIEQRGEAGETPYIAIAGVFLFLLPIFCFMVGVAFAAYYITK